jgi:hypothetical protein
MLALALAITWNRRSGLYPVLPLRYSVACELGAAPLDVSFGLADGHVHRTPLLRINGQRVQETSVTKMMGTDIDEFAIAPEFVKDRKLVLTWDRPQNDGGLNWRQRSRLAEISLIVR